MAISYEYDEVAQKMQVHIEQIQESAKPYILPMAIDVYQAGGGVERHQVVVQNTVETFFFDAPQLPKLVNVDAEKDAARSEKRIKKHWKTGYTNTNLLRSISTDTKPLPY